MSFIYGALVVEGSCETEKLVDIHVLGFFPCDTSSELSSIYSCDGIIDRIPTVKLALEEINERCDLLPGYRLVVDYANSAVSCPRMLLSSVHLLTVCDMIGPSYGAWLSLFPLHIC